MDNFLDDTLANPGSSSSSSSFLSYAFVSLAFTAINAPSFSDVRSYVRPELRPFSRGNSFFASDRPSVLLKAIPLLTRPSENFKAPAEYMYSAGRPPLMNRTFEALQGPFLER